jgi:hypothetical protein
MPEIYRGSPKHKNRPARGRKGTLCPEWTHSTAASALGTDINGHSWHLTEAHRLLQLSEPCPEGSGRTFATSRGIAFVAVRTNDGTWHGYPVPWQGVPTELKDRWQEQGRVTRRDLTRFLDRAPRDIRWAMETDDDA